MMAIKGTSASRAASASSMLSPRYSAVTGSRPPRIFRRPSGCGFLFASSIVMTVRKYFVAGQRSNVKENSCRVRPVKRFDSNRRAHRAIAFGVTTSFSLRSEIHLELRGSPQRGRNTRGSRRKLQKGGYHDRREEKIHEKRTTRSSEGFERRQKDRTRVASVLLARRPGYGEY